MRMLHARSPVKSVLLSVFAVALAICGVLGQAQIANAGTIIETSPNGSTWTAVPGLLGTETAGGSFSVVSVNGVSVSGFSFTSNWPGTTSSANTSTATTTLINTTGATQTVYVLYSISGFTGPQAPPSAALWASFSGVVETGGPNNTSAGTVSMIGSINASNVLGSAGLPGNFQAVVPTVALPSLASYSSTTGVDNVNLLSGAFTLNQLIRVDIAAGAKISVTGTVSVSNPEPATMSLLSIGLVGMAAYGWRKRRQQLTQNVA